MTTGRATTVLRAHMEARRLIFAAASSARRAVSAARKAAQIAQDEWARLAGIPDTRDDRPGDYERAIAKAKRAPTVRPDDLLEEDYWLGALDRAFLAAGDAVIAVGRTTNIAAGDATARSRPATEIAAALNAARFAASSAKVVAAAGRLAADSIRGEWIAGHDIAAASAAKAATEAERLAGEAAHLCEKACALTGYEPGTYRRRGLSR